MSDQDYEDIKKYLHFRIDLLAAIHFGFHRSPYFPSLLLPTTLWKSQIPDFEEWKKIRPTHSFHQIGI